MPDLDTQLREYATWLGGRADATEPAPASSASGATPPSSGPRFALLLVAAAVVALVVGAAVVATRPDGDRIATAPTPTEPRPTDAPASTASVVPPASSAGPATSVGAAAPGEPLIVATPDPVPAGGLLELRFPSDHRRGAAWYLEAATESGWSSPQYLLIAAFDGYECADCPTWYGPGEQWAWEDIGAGGRGPDIVRIPDVAEPGRYRLCTANAPEAACVELTVTDAVESPPDEQASTSRFDLPSGSLTAGPDDLFVLHEDGDLYLHPGALGTSPGVPVRWIDRDDPRTPPGEGSGPNVIDHVAGIVDGTLVYGDCCEPIAGTVYGLTRLGSEPQMLSFGYIPTLDESGAMLAAASIGIGITDLGSRTTTSRQFDPVLGNAYDLMWSGDRVLALLWGPEQGWTIAPHARAAPHPPVSDAVDIGFDDLPADRGVRFAGSDRTGAPVVALARTGATELVALDPSTLVPGPGPIRSLPDGAQSVRYQRDGSLLWVDGSGRVWSDRTDGDPQVVAEKARAAWFVTATEARFDADGIDLDDSSVLGIEPLWPLDVEWTIDDVRARLGAPTFDTGWIAAVDPECVEAGDYRTVWWGDLRLTFERTATVTMLAEWSVGDPSVVSMVPLGPEPPTREPASGVSFLGSDVGVGDVIEDAVAVFGDRMNGGDAERWQVAGARAILLSLDDGTITGIGSSRNDCWANADGL